jgi:hypothetical protein
MRSDVINSLLAKPWEANAHGPDAFDCWHLAMFVQRELFSLNLPDVDVPENPSWAWMIEAIDGHAERGNWRLVPADRMGLVTAADGAMVLMARSDRPAHIGVWLKPERFVIHADPRNGVVCDGLLDLRTKGWAKLRFYERCH